MRETIPTPYYLIDESALLRNLRVIDQVREQAGAKVLLALKCFATWSVFDLMREHMVGTTSSSLYEVKLGRQKFGGETHAYSVAFADHEIEEVVAHCDKIIFNSLSQFERFKSSVKGRPIGLRLNPGVSCAGFDLADDAVGAFQIGRYHAGSQAVGGGVGAHNHFFFGGVAQNAHHRAEDFFAHDGHVVEAVGKHSGGNVSAFVKRVCIEALPARKQAPTFGAAFFDIGEHFFHMGKARQGAEIGVCIKRVADADARHAL